MKLRKVRTKSIWWQSRSLSSRSKSSGVSTKMCLFNRHSSCCTAIDQVFGCKISTRKSLSRCRSSTNLTPPFEIACCCRTTRTWMQKGFCQWILVRNQSRKLQSKLISSIMLAKKRFVRPKRHHSEHLLTTWILGRQRTSFASRGATNGTQDSTL